MFPVLVSCRTLQLAWVFKTVPGPAAVFFSRLGPSKLFLSPFSTAVLLSRCGPLSEWRAFLRHYCLYNCTFCAWRPVWTQISKVFFCVFFRFRLVLSMTRAKNKWPKSDEKGRFGGTLPCKPRHIWPAAAFGHYQSFSENDTPDYICYNYNMLRCPCTVGC